MDTSSPKSLVGALRDFFGLKPEQTLSGFMAEVKALNEAERAFFKTELEKAGYTITA